MTERKSDCLIFYVNGKKIAEKSSDPEWTLLFYLRTKLKLTGTKLGCGEGGCGACTVMLSKFHAGSQSISHMAVNACLVPVCGVHGQCVTTVEGIGSVATSLHPVQERLARSHGSQCGFCTPGIVMSVYSLLRNDSRPSLADIETCLQGNLCRCTGYRPILDAVRGLGDGGRQASCSPCASTCPGAAQCAASDRFCPQQYYDTTATATATATEDHNQKTISTTIAKSATIDKSPELSQSTMSAATDTGHLAAHDVPNDQQDRGAREDRGVQDACDAQQECGVSDDYGESCEELPVQLLDGGDQLPLYDEAEQLPFPQQLLAESAELEVPVEFHGARASWYRSADLAQLLQLKQLFPSAKIVGGNTEIGVEVRNSRKPYAVLVCCDLVSELHTVCATESGVTVGGALTLSQLHTTLSATLPSIPAWKSQLFAAILEMLHWFAGKQIRNTASIGGNIMTGSPISDLIPLLSACGCVLQLVSARAGYRTVPLRGFYTAYRQNRAEPDEILLTITLPYTKQTQFVKGFKQAIRREDDIAIVNAGMMVEFDQDDVMAGAEGVAPACEGDDGGVTGLKRVRCLSLCYGGMAATATHALHTEQLAVGREWEECLLREAVSVLLSDLPLSYSAPGGLIQYRRTLTISFFLRFFLAVNEWLTKDVQQLWHAPRSLQHLLCQQSNWPTGSQLFQAVAADQSRCDLVGRPVAHLSAAKQVSGEAGYCDDAPAVDGQLYAGLVLSTRAHAQIRAIDPAQALALDGVVAFYSAKDISAERNCFGALPTYRDEQVFRSVHVTFMGQLIGLILANDKATAQTAARAVKVEYHELPCIVTIEEAIEQKSFFGECRRLQYGGAQDIISTAQHVISGEFRMGAQEHFYLETLACIAVPGEDGGVDVVSSNQALTASQATIARVLGVAASRVVCRAKRLGGGFGGKETRATWLDVAIAFAATKCGRPVRIMLDRDEDMISTGTRHSFLGRYSAAVEPSTGRVAAVMMTLYSNGGAVYDLSESVMSRAMAHCDNGYHFPAYHIEGHICRTNITPATAFRGFGGPQGCAMAEALMNDISVQLQLPAEQVRAVNLYRHGQCSLTRQLLDNCTIGRCWRYCLNRAQYHKRLSHVQKFNSAHRWRKRGIAIIPNKYGIGFGAQFMNQGGALVHIYTDGSALVSTGGVEMGQGLHTKCCQIVTRVLGISVDQVYINETATDKVANSSPTAASMSTDLYGAAVQSACETLWNRLTPFRDANPSGSFANWVHAAYMARVSLTAHGFYASKSQQYDPKTYHGDLYNYFVYGAACSVVEIDCLTGAHKVLQTDIVMDIGRSLNPAIDIGQIEGAFMQGYGLFCMERLKYSPKGFNYTRGPGAYKIPGFADIPGRLSVTLLPGTGNPRAVYSSKAVGEPPLFSGAAVFFAIRHAITAARQCAAATTASATTTATTTTAAAAKEPNMPQPRHFSLQAPATPDRVRMACEDWLTALVPPPDVPAGATPWMLDP